MRLLTLTVATFVTELVVGLPNPVTRTRHTLHEKRDFLPTDWERRERLDKSTLLPVRIALKQSNLDQGHDVLMDISDPDSPNYGQHWSMKQITDFFAPSQETVDAVTEWLSSSGIHSHRLSKSRGMGWINFDATAEEVERLIQAEYYLYEHPSGNSHVACEFYGVPEGVREHVDFITPTVHFDTSVPGPRHEKRSIAKRAGKGRFKLPGGLWGGPTIGENIGPYATAATAANLSSCNTQITLACLRALYNLPKGTLNQSSYGIVEYAPESFIPSDLDMFFQSTTTDDDAIPVGTRPIFDGIDGGFLLGTSSESFNNNGEADLDLQYAMGLVYPQSVTLYQVGDNGTNSDMITFNNFLDALDASYCTYEGGDTPGLDEAFPDPNGYQGKENCGTVAPTAVISTSYGYNEHDLSPAYEQRQCNEYMKLGMAGTSFLYSSGDYGVAGNGGECINPSTGAYNSGNSGKFNPSFPGTCPYVTSVGATQIKPGATVTQPEEACETVIYSGGGFSNVFPIPSYQSSAVASYFANHKPSYTATQYNNSQKVRGYPDVAANGANYVVAIDGSFELVYGTSASAPTFGSVITLINEQRAAAGKKSLGFLNTIFYKNPSMFNDITSGGNQGCGTAGFTAVPGWDPVTGLGTPNYTAMAPILVAA